MSLFSGLSASSIAPMDIAGRVAPPVPPLRPVPRVEAELESLGSGEDEGE